MRPKVRHLFGESRCRAAIAEWRHDGSFRFSTTHSRIRAGYSDSLEPRDVATHHWIGPLDLGHNGPRGRDPTTLLLGNIEQAELALSRSSPLFVSRWLSDRWQVWTCKVQPHFHLLIAACIARSKNSDLLKVSMATLNSCISHFSLCRHRPTILSMAGRNR